MIVGAREDGKPLPDIDDVERERATRRRVEPRRKHRNQQQHAQRATRHGAR